MRFSIQVLKGERHFKNLSFLYDDAQEGRGGDVAEVFVEVLVMAGDDDHRGVVGLALLRNLVFQIPSASFIFAIISARISWLVP